MEIKLIPVAYVKNDRSEISDDFWGGLVSEITLTDDFDENALKGIEEYSHLEIIFYFDKADPQKVQTGARHPRNNTSWPEVGIFVQRGKNRPNRLGLTTTKLLKREGKKIFVAGLDAIDGTPVVDIKPVIKEFLPQGDITQPEWADELMKDYWKK